MPTAETLMRSRFSAFSECLADYLVETHHPDSRSGNDRAEVLDTIRSTEWLNLIVLSTSRGGENDDEGHVEFVAVCRQKSLNLLASGGGDALELQQLHERSFFLRENGRWLYVDGDRLPPYQPKRNDPCVCGSGKKFKQCHG